MKQTEDKNNKSKIINKNCSTTKNNMGNQWNREEKCMFHEHNSHGRPYKIRNQIKLNRKISKNFLHSFEWIVLCTLFGWHEYACEYKYFLYVDIVQIYSRNFTPFSIRCLISYSDFFLLLCVLRFALWSTKNFLHFFYLKKREKLLNLKIDIEVNDSTVKVCMELKEKLKHK